jgi:hypothetical protein
LTYIGPPSAARPAGVNLALEAILSFSHIKQEIASAVGVGLPLLQPCNQFMYLSTLLIFGLPHALKLSARNLRISEILDSALGARPILCASLRPPFKFLLRHHLFGDSSNCTLQIGRRGS